MQDIEREVKERITKILEDSDVAKAGSDEQKALIHEACELGELFLKVKKSEEDIFNNDAIRQKNHAETAKIKAEIDKLNEEDIPMDLKRWIAQIRPDQVVNAIVIISITVAAFRMEKTGFIFPERLVKFGMRLFSK